MHAQRIVMTIVLGALTFLENSASAQKPVDTYRHLESGPVIVVGVNGGNAFLAYSQIVGVWTRFTFPDGVKAVPITSGGGLIAFNIEGKGITELVAIDQKGEWCVTKLSGATQKCTPKVSQRVAVYFIDGMAHAFSGELGKWDSVAAPVEPVFSDNDAVLIVARESIAVFSPVTGKWAVAQVAK